MSLFIRALGLAVSGLLVMLASAGSAWAETDNQDQTVAPVTITVQVPRSPAASTTSINLRVATDAATQRTDVNVVGNTSPSAPALVAASVDGNSVATIPVDTSHTFDWIVYRDPRNAGCGPHPAAGTPGCAPSGARRGASGPSGDSGTPGQSEGAIDIEASAQSGAAVESDVPAQRDGEPTQGEATAQSAPTSQPDPPADTDIAVRRDAAAVGDVAMLNAATSDGHLSVGSDAPAQSDPVGQGDMGVEGIAIADSDPSAQGDGPVPSAATTESQLSAESDAPAHSDVPGRSDAPAAASQTQARAAAGEASSAADDPSPLGAPARHATGSPEHYTVHAGDTLSRIALRAYGTADAVDRILEANLGQRMSDGVVFADPNQIHTGWTLVLPPPARAVTDTGGASSQYVVQPGDSLSSIAARQVGSANRWPELYALNGDQLVSPSLLPVGLHLQLPGGAMPGQASGASTSGAHS